MKTLNELYQQTGLRIERIGDDGGCGVIQRGKLTASVIWSNGGGWEHVSISPFKTHQTPTWDEMCWLKDTFFHEDEWVAQFHPAKSEYVNNVGNCLHLWRPIEERMPTPPSWMVGVKGAELR